MRKIIAGMFITLDGVVKAPEKWNPPYYDDELNQDVMPLLAAAGTHLYGRRSYELFRGVFTGPTAARRDDDRHPEGRRLHHPDQPRGTMAPRSDCPRPSWNSAETAGTADSLELPCDHPAPVVFSNLSSTATSLPCPVALNPVTPGAAKPDDGGGRELCPRHRRTCWRQGWSWRSGPVWSPKLRVLSACTPAVWSPLNGVVAPTRPRPPPRRVRMAPSGTWSAS
jgi:hypothetical protein